MAIKVLIVDDSAVVRRMLTASLNADGDINVVGSAPDPLVAAEMIEVLCPDVITLDIEMPRMDGLTFLQGLMRHRPLPVLVVSSLTAAGSQKSIEALALGAMDALCKPHANYAPRQLATDLIERIKAIGHRPMGQAHALTAAATQDMPRRPRGIPQAEAVPAVPDGQIIAIGASTGGTQAIESVLRRLPAGLPGIVIVQHMPEHFTRSFAERLDGLCTLVVREAADGDIVQPGTALIAPGNFHLQVRRRGQAYRALVRTGPKVCRQRPSVEVLFQSVAAQAGPRAIGVMLTGMGRDGADAMRLMKEQGARNIAQDEASSVVFGMPKEAIAAGAVDSVLALQEIPAQIVRLAARPMGEA